MKTYLLKKTYKIKAIGLEIMGEDLVGEFNQDTLFYKGVLTNIERTNIKIIGETWRLPTINELTYLQKLAGIFLHDSHPILNFNWGILSWYWSSTETQSDKDDVLLRNISKGERTICGKSEGYAYRARLVRDIG